MRIPAMRNSGPERFIERDWGRSVTMNHGASGEVRGAALAELSKVWPSSGLKSAWKLKDDTDTHLAQTARNVINTLTPQK